MKNTISESKEENVRKYIHDEAQSLRDEAFSTKQPIPPEKVEALERLYRIANMSKVTQPPPPKPARKRWLTVALLGVVLLGISGLHKWKLSATDIQMDLIVTDVRFMLSEAWPLIEKMVLSSELGVFVLREIQFSDAENRGMQTFTAPEGMAVRLTVKSTERISGSLTFTDLQIPAQTEVWVNQTDVTNQYRLVLTAPEKETFTLTLGVQGEIEALLPKTVEQFLYAKPGAIRMQSASNQLILDISLLPGNQLIFPTQLSVSDLALLRIDRSKSRDREVSTVQSGTLYFSSFNNREYKLRTGEKLRFDQANGLIQRLTLKDDLIAVQFYGDVSGMRAGWEKHPQNLMPSHLEWFRTRPWFTVIVSTGISLFVFILGIVKWWKTEK
jgi:hypothetical protein